MGDVAVVPASRDGSEPRRAPPLARSGRSGGQASSFAAPPSHRSGAGIGVTVSRAGAASPTGAASGSARQGFEPLSHGLAHTMQRKPSKRLCCSYAGGACLGRAASAPSGRAGRPQPQTRASTRRPEGRTSCAPPERKSGPRRATHSLDQRDSECRGVLEQPSANPVAWITALLWLARSTGARWAPVGTSWVGVSMVCPGRCERDESQPGLGGKAAVARPGKPRQRALAAFGRLT